MADYKSKSDKELLDMATIYCYQIKDYSLALPLIRELANRGNAEGQAWLGMCYCEGNGVAKDDSEAFKWFSKAAEKGDKNGQYLLGMSYYLGDGVQKDSEKGIYWIRKAAAQGHEEALETLKKIGVPITAPSSTSSYTPPPSSATSKPAAPVAPKPAPAPSSVGTIANGIWQYKAPVLGFINIKHKHEGKYITKGENLIQFKAGKAGSGGQSYDIKAEVDGYITKMADTYQKNAGEILVEITIGKKRLFG